MANIFTKTLLAAALTAAVVVPMRADEAEEPAETWHQLGTGMLRDDIVTCFWYVSNYEFPVEILESDETPGRYFINNPYSGYPMSSSAQLLNHRHGFVVDASDPEHVWIEKGCLGLNLTEDGWEYVIWSIADNEYNNKWGDWDIVEQEEGAVWGTLTDGSITFPRHSLLVHYYQPPKEYLEDLSATYDPNGDWTLPTDGFRPANESGLFRIQLPGAPRYDLQILRLEDTLGEGDTDVTFNFAIDMEKDVKYIRYAMVEGAQPDKAIADLSAGGGTKIDAPAADGLGHISAKISIPYEKDGRHTLVVVPFNADGEARTAEYLTMDFAYDQSEWKKCGTASYTEAILSSCEVTNNVLSYFGPKEHTYDVDVELSVQKPGLIRLVDPYGPNYPQYFEDIYDSTRRYYLEIDATDEDHVHILRTTAGIGLDTGYGTSYIWSRANRSLTTYGKTVEEVEEEGTFGFFNTAKAEITFPKEALLFEFRAAMGNMYYANENGYFCVKLGDEAMKYYREQVAQSVNGIMDGDTESEPEYYTIDGVRVENAERGGLYIVRQGNRSYKVIK